MRLHLRCARTVTWHGSDGPKSWGYRDILMHAISKEGDSPALYAQVQGADEYELFELRFVPEEASILDNLYAAFSRGACLNPDEVVEDDGEGEFYFNVEEVEAGLNGEMDGDDDVQEDGEAAEPSS